MRNLFYNFWHLYNNWELETEKLQPYRWLLNLTLNLNSFISFIIETHSLNVERVCSAILNCFIKNTYHQTTWLAPPSPCSRSPLGRCPKWHGNCDQWRWSTWLALSVWLHSDIYDVQSLGRRINILFNVCYMSFEVLMQKTLDLEVKCCLKCPPWICTNTDYAFPRSRDYCLRIKGKIYWKGII